MNINEISNPYLLKTYKIVILYFRFCDFVPLLNKRDANIVPNITYFLKSVRSGAAGVLGPLTRLSNVIGITKLD